MTVAPWAYLLLPVLGYVVWWITRGSGRRDIGSARAPVTDEMYQAVTGVGDLLARYGHQVQWSYVSSHVLTAVCGRCGGSLTATAAGPARIDTGPPLTGPDGAPARCPGKSRR
jgi:hypothetical protein